MYGMKTQDKKHKMQVERHAELFLIAMVIALIMMFSTLLALALWFLGVLQIEHVVVITTIVVFLHMLINNITPKIKYIIENKEI